MSGAEKPYELTISLSIGGTEAELDNYTKHLEDAVVHLLNEYQEITAYFVVADHEAVEIELGLRFEDVDPKKIEGIADQLLNRSIEAASSDSTPRQSPVREESTLVPA